MMLPACQRCLHGPLQFQRPPPPGEAPSQPSPQASFLSHTETSLLDLSRKQDTVIPFYGLGFPVCLGMRLFNHIVKYEKKILWDRSVHSCCVNGDRPSPRGSSDDCPPHAPSMP